MRSTAGSTTRSTAGSARVQRSLDHPPPIGALPAFDDVPPEWHHPIGDALFRPDRLAGFDEDSLLDEPGPQPTKARDARPPHERLLQQFGGIIATRELLAANVDAMVIRMLVGTRRLARLRKGWYGSPDLPVQVALAWRIGGPLACISALAHHGLLDEHDLGADPTLHVCLRSNTSRLPSTLTIETYPNGGRAPSAVVRHWSTPDVHSGDRTAVSLAAALEQARHCRPLLARRARDRLSSPTG